MAHILCRIFTLLSSLSSTYRNTHSNLGIYNEYHTHLIPSSISSVRIENVYI